MRESGSPEILDPRGTDCGRLGSAELLRSRRRRCRHRSSGLAMIELPGVTESGMLRRNGQRKPGTTRGSPRRSRTAKASRISCHAVKSRCARGWGGWGRLSDDGSRQHNSSKSEDPWGGGLPHLHGGARSYAQPDSVRDYCDYCGRFDVRERQAQTKHPTAYAGSRLKPAMLGKVLSYMPAFPDCGGREVTRVPTANCAVAAIAHTRCWYIATVSELSAAGES